MDFDTWNYWDRLNMIIKLLVEQNAIKNGEELYEALELGVKEIEQLKRGETVLSLNSAQVLQTEYRVSSDFLQVGLGPVFQVVHSDDDILTDEYEEEEAFNVKAGEISAPELKDILKDAIHLSEQDLRNKGHVEDE